jgi:hypothetical protein
MDIRRSVVTFVCVTALLTLGGSVLEVVEVQDSGRFEACIIEDTVLGAQGLVFVLTKESNHIAIRQAVIADRNAMSAVFGRLLRYTHIAMLPWTQPLLY